jgi:UDP-glucose-4-epimerase GalE
MNVLVTGGAGYIGSHTAKALAKARFSPVVLDNLSMGHAENVRWGPLIEADLSDKKTVRQVLKEREIEAVIHFAGSAYVGESMHDPRLYFRNNVVNTSYLLDAMLDQGVRNLVFSSTCATYGNPEQIPISENHPQKPVNPYGESKLFIERMMYWTGEAEKLRWVALRYFNAAGCDPDGELGEQHEPETHLIPRVLRVALGIEPYIGIYGTDYPTPDGTAIRDYIHVTDLADAHVLALQHLLNSGQSMAMNLGSATGSSVREVIATAERTCACPIAIKEVPRRPGDPAKLVADHATARRVLQWCPRYSSLATILETAWSWHSKQVLKQP